MENFNEKPGNFVEKSKKSGEISKRYQKFADLEYFLDLKHFWGVDLCTNFVLFLSNPFLFQRH
jgi:hypothetical protein